MANEPKRIKWCIEGIADAIDSCNEWEQKFISSIEEQFHKRGSITDKQYDILERIYEEKCQ